MRILRPIKGRLPRVEKSSHCVRITSLPSFSSIASPPFAASPSTSPTSSYSERPIAWMGMLRRLPSAVETRFKKVRRTRAGKKLSVRSGGPGQ